MRRTAVAILIAALSAGLVFFLVTRERSDEGLASAAPTADKSGEAKAKPGATTAEQAPDAPTVVKLGRPLRIVSHGWDLIVPGLVADKAKAFEKRGLEVEFRSVAKLSGVEAALAAGGEQKNGADIAIVALPLLALSYENIKPLAPELFWVVGHSRGRDAVYAKSATLVKPPSYGVKLTGDRERASTFFGLFALDLAGVDLSKVSIVSPGDVKSSSANYAAIDRSAANANRLAEERRALVSTSEATEAIPFVAIAPRGFLDSKGEVATSFAAAWLEGLEELRRDVPTAARAIAKQSNTPEPVTLLKRLGQLEFADLATNAELFALSGRGAVSAHQLYRDSFRIWRRAGMINSAPPETAPIASGPVSNLVFGKNIGAKTAARAKRAEDAKPILIRRAKKVDIDTAVAELGTVAGLFTRSVIEVGFDGRKKATALVIARATERFGIDASRLVSAPKRSKRRGLTLAVMPIP